MICGKEGKKVYLCEKHLKFLSNKKEIKCPKCGHHWLYAGKSKHFITCPHCLTKIKFENVFNNSR